MCVCDAAVGKSRSGVDRGLCVRHRIKAAGGGDGGSSTLSQSDEISR